MRKAVVFFTLTGMLAACGAEPDFEGRSREIQLRAFGHELVRSQQLEHAYASPDERSWVWIYGLKSGQRAQLASRCVRPMDATSPFRPFRSEARRTVPGCLMWEGTNNESALVILLSETTLEIREEPKG